MPEKGCQDAPTARRSETLPHQPHRLSLRQGRRRIAHLGILAAVALGAGRLLWLSPAGARQADDLAGLPRYRAINLGEIALNQGSQATKISDGGFVTGSAMNQDTRQHAFVWKDDGQGGKMTDLGVLASTTSHGVAVNSAGQVVGMTNAKQPMPGTSSTPYIIVGHPFLWKDGQMTDIFTLSRHDESWQPTAINNKGQVVGGASLSGGGQVACLWQRGNLTNLGRLDGSEATAYAINDRGVVVGRSTIARQGGLKHAFIYRSGQMLDLGTLPGGTSSEAYGVNRQGDVVGNATVVTAPALTNASLSRNHAFLYRRGRMTDLGTLGGDNSCAWAINDAGQIVGIAMKESARQQSHYVLWQDGKAVLLEKLVFNIDDWFLWPGHSAGPVGQIDINNQGQIVCTGQPRKSGNSCAVLLDPISPASAASPANAVP